VNSREDVEYRLDLSKGFLREAEQDFQLGRWRSCVANAQLSVENAGKAVLMLFGVSTKTHEPANHMAQLIKSPAIPKQAQDKIKDILPDFLLLGAEEHFMTDYGDESSYKLPWELFDEESARSALDAARKCKAGAEDIVGEVHRWRS
jgi:HEPN domain-containing protein